MIWEYKTLTLPSSAERQSMLTEMGLNGWELVGFEQGLAYFKRAKAITVDVSDQSAADLLAMSDAVEKSSAHRHKKK